MTDSNEKGTPILIAIVSPFQTSRNSNCLLIIRHADSLDWPRSGQVLLRELRSIMLGRSPISSMTITTWPLLE